MILAGCDIETTGLDQSAGHRIIEIAIVFYDETGKRLGAWEQRINPQRPIDAKAQEVHGIAFSDLAECPTWEAVAPKVSMLLAKPQVVVAHNGAGFDLPFIANELIRVGQPVSSPHVIDTMLDGRWATPLGKLPNLGELCFATGIPYDKSQAHAATYDVEVMMAAFFVGLRKGFYQLPIGAAERMAA